MKFKVGDKVRVLTATEINDGVSIDSSKLRVCKDKVMEITDLHSDSGNNNVYYERGYRYWLGGMLFKESELELVENKTNDTYELIVNFDSNNNVSQTQVINGVNTNVTTSLVENNTEVTYTIKAKNMKTLVLKVKKD